MENVVITAENASKIIASRDARIAELEALVKYYEAQLLLAKHRQFGSSSEKGEVPEQLGLFDEAENTADPKQSEPELEEITYKRKKRVGKREDDLSGLPVETVEYTLPESDQVCPDCGSALHTMGCDSRRELTIIPAQVKVVEHKRTVYSCRHCENHSDHVPIVKAPMPEPVIKGSLASPSAVSHEALKATPEMARAQSIAWEAIKRLGALFHLEALWKGTPSDERQKLRLEESKPLAEAFFAWLDAININILPKSPIGTAINYAISQRRWLMNFYLDGRCELSNNRAENSIRPFVMGRKNWLFCNTQRGAKASSVVYSIIETAKANGLKPFEYLCFLFETIPNTTTGKLDSILPWGEDIPHRCRLAGMP